MKTYHFNVPFSIKESIFDSNIKNCSEEPNYSMFCDSKYGENTLFVIAHGSKKGKILLGTHDNPKEYTPEQFLKENIVSFKQLRYSTIYLVCCHGFYMKPAIVEGITIRPFTNDKETITAILHHNYSQESLTLDLDVISNTSS